MDYIQRALSPACLPILSVSPPAEAELDRTVLDPTCANINFLSNIDSFLEDDHAEIPIEFTHMFTAISDCVKSRRLGKTLYVLSLSGGVDSMCLAVMLKKLRLGFVAVHIRHSSRLEDTEKELNWVSFVCHKLGVPLYYHHVLVLRPHASTGGPGNGLTREMFEEYTRQIRFEMYRKAAALAATAAGFPTDDRTPVIIGHHLDDVDENRIAELGKGNLIDIDGMNEGGGEDHGFQGITQLRPLCGIVRKSWIYKFAKKFYIPHMHNSTPKWSKRGWIRDTLDSMTGDQHAWFLATLESLGNVSRQLDATLKCIPRMSNDGPVAILVDTKSKKFSLPRSQKVDFSLMIAMVEKEAIQPLRDMLKVTNEFSIEWNRVYQSFAESTEERRGMCCPIQRIRRFDSEDTSELLVIGLSRALQVNFSFLRPILGLDKYVPKKSVEQLLELLRGGRNCVAWKIGKIDINMVHVDGVWYVLDSSVFDEILAREFAGSRDAFRKCISSNPNKISVS